MTTTHTKSVSRRGWLPLAVFVLVFVLHALYVRHEVRLPAQGWADAGIVDNGFWGFGPYLRARDYFTGYSYALPLAFVTVALRRYREQRMCASRNLAVGGVTLTGFLAFAGCFLIGCCGSPMLGVYLSLFGASFLPWAKPLVAGLTTTTIGASYCWMRRRSSASGTTDAVCSCITSERARVKN